MEEAKVHSGLAPTEEDYVFIWSAGHHFTMRFFDTR
jgi:hypothetical protein